MRNDYQHITVTPISGTLGAEIGNVDLSADNPQGVYDEIHRALLENLVIFFRDQDITPEQHLSFAKRWGDLHQRLAKERHGRLSGHPGDHQTAHRREEFRWWLAFGSDVLRKARYGHDPLRKRDAHPWRRHTVCQHVRGL